MAKKIVTPVEVQASVKGDESVKSLRDTLKEAQQEADKLAKELGKDSDAYKKAAENVAKLKTEIKDGNIKTQLKEAQFEAIRLAQALGQTSPEALKAAGRVAELRDQMDDFNATVKGLHPDRFQKFANITATLANGFAAAQGAAALLGSESEDLQKSMARVQGAMAFAQGISALKDVQFQLGNIPKMIYSKVVPAFTTAAGAARAIGMALGIGVIIAGVTALIALFQKLDLSIDGVSKSDKELAKSQEARLKASKDNVDALDAQDNILKLQGKSERQILEMKIAALKTAIDNQRAVIETGKAQAKQQIQAAQRNKDILRGILDFITKPSEWLLKLVDKLASMLGYDTGLAKVFSETKDAMVSLVFDPEKEQKAAEETQREQEKALTDMENKVAGHKLAIQAIDANAEKERKAASKAEQDRQKEEQDKLTKQAEDAEKERIRIAQEAEKKRIADAQWAEQMRKQALDNELAYVKGFYDEQELAAMRAATSKEDLEKRMAEITKQRLINELQALKDAGASTIEVEKAIEAIRLADAQAASEERKTIAKTEAELKQQLEKDVLASLGAIAQIAGENSKVGKAIALAQIAYDTGKAISGALAVTQSMSGDNVATGGLAGIAKFAAISAAILTNSARAIRIVKSGNVQQGGGGGNLGNMNAGRNLQAPSMPSSTLGGGTQFAGSFDNKVYVTEGDITGTQRRVRQNRGVSVI